MTTITRPLRTAKSIHGQQVTEELLCDSEALDGGRWALYCHHEGFDGDIGILQDTNRNRLWAWARFSNEWCPYCQEIEDTKYDAEIALTGSIRL
jgi:hypothetical protein